MDYAELLGRLAALERNGVDCVLIDSVAANLRGVIRATEHVDLFVLLDVENLARLRDAPVDA